MTDVLLAETGRRTDGHFRHYVVADTDRISICVDAGHKTMENILSRKAFTVSIATEDQALAADYVGIVSGNKVPDKLKNTGWQILPSETVDAPLFQELPMALECKVKSFSDGILVGEIVNVSADESVVTDGKIDLKKLKPIAFDPCNYAYVALGEKVGNAFEDGAKLK